MTNDETIIRQLLDKFMDGQTTVDEERHIAEWFRSHKQASPDLEDYRTMFAWFDEGMPRNAEGGMALPATGDEVRATKHTTAWLWTAIATAASVAAMLMITLGGGHGGTTINGGSHTPVVAVTERHDTATTSPTTMANTDKDAPKAYAVKHRTKSRLSDIDKHIEENINSLYSNVETEEADSVGTAVTVEPTPPPALYAQAEPEDEGRPVLIGETVNDESRKQLMPMTAESLINMAIARMESQQNEVLTAYARHTEECERIVDGIIRGDGMTARQEEVY